MVASKSEQIIADTLADRQILCHYDQPVSGAPRFRYDFYLPLDDVYIEYWGLTGDRAYERRRAEKEEEYRRRGARLISLDPSDDGDLANVLDQRLRGFGIGFPPPRPRGWLRSVLRLIGRMLRHR